MLQRSFSDFLMFQQLPHIHGKFFVLASSSGKEKLSQQISSGRQKINPSVNKGCNFL